MKRMKQILIMLLCLLLTGCAAPVGEPEPAPVPTVPEEAAQTEPAPQTEPTVLETAKSQSSAQALMETMTADEKLWQLLIVTPEQLTGVGLATVAGERTVEALREKPVGGLIYFSDNLQDGEQVRALLSGTQAASKLPLFLCVDEEGGLVSRLGGKPGTGVPKLPPAGSIEDAAQAYQRGATLGAALLSLGFNLNFAPVADVNSNPNNPVIGNRAFSADPETAADYTASCVRGYLDAGLLCTLKHFPGHGDTATDSHYGAAVTEKDRNALEDCELVPFRAGIEAGAPFVMVGHIGVPNVTGDDLPASVSGQLVTGLLRGELGFDGLIVTDSFQMEAITGRFAPGEAAVTAIEAGVDIILMPEDADAAVQGLKDALEDGRLTQERIDESVLRILKCKLGPG